MSGHSHWATIRRKKGAADAKRGQVFTRLAREIVLAAREGGGDPDNNVGLAIAIDKARASNMPKDNIERAIKRGTGDSKEGGTLEQVFYEGYAPHGVALMVETVTDNRNRAVSDIRHALSRHGGSMAEAGSVSWQFNRIVAFSFPLDALDPDKTFDTEVEITGPIESFKSISESLRAAKIKPDEAGMRHVPSNEIELSDENTMQVLRLVEALEEMDDVQNVYHNMKVSDAVWAQLEEA
jgi:YebC/PmpR family DNA-binding regulatory protein